ncbi:MAG: hypothetical protein LBF27_33115 [Sphingobacterium sp.]|jgi:hypothetical protein|nr:hypothetical protein [Sphingobacterium sp.]
MNYKDLHIGSYIKNKVVEDQVELDRIMTYFKLKEEEIIEMYNESELSTGILLKWSKLLEYDFFRLYSQHLILYSPQKGERTERTSSVLPNFRKKIYTKELIDFVLDLIRTGEKTMQEIITDYRIPKTTLYKWIDKYAIENGKQD